MALPHQRDVSSGPDRALDTPSDRDFEAFGDVPNALQCFRDCSHCRACFNLDYDIYSPFSQFEGEREIESILSDIATSAKNDCEICSLLISGAEIALSADKTGKAFNEIRRSQVTIRIRRGRPVNLHFRIHDWDLMELEYYTISGHPTWPALGVAKPLVPCLDLDSCMDVIRRWIRDCMNGHDRCKSNSPKVLPARLLDVMPGGGLIKLVASNLVKTQEPRPYTALSHCWGNPKDLLTTTKATLRRRLTGISFEELPRTFLDAVLITQKLGVQYLWIDALCIVQDDKLDWDAQSAEMADIYSGSYLTISALHSPNCHGGCFSPRWTQYSESFPWRWSLHSHEIPNTYPSVFVRFALSIAHNQFFRGGHQVGDVRDSTPLLRRGWVFQERLLSPRILHFHSEELVWECNTFTKCECEGFRGLDKLDLQLNYVNRHGYNSQYERMKKIFTSISRGETSKPECADFWLDIVSEFSELTLTYSTDGLPALSGLASRFSSQMDGPYFAGLWRYNLIPSLTWELWFPYPEFTQRLQPYCAPTWSWASINTWAIGETEGRVRVRISYDLVRVKGFIPDSRVKLRDVSYLLAGVNRFGPASKAILNIQGPFIKAKQSSAFWYQQSGFESGVDTRKVRTVQYRGDENTVNSDVTSDAADSWEDCQVYCFLLGSTTKKALTLQELRLWHNDMSRQPHEDTLDVALVLRRTKENPVVCERIGIVRLLKRSNWFGGARLNTMYIR